MSHSGYMVQYRAPAGTVGAGTWIPDTIWFDYTDALARAHELAQTLEVRIAHAGRPASFGGVF